MQTLCLVPEEFEAEAREALSGVRGIEVVVERRSGDDQRWRREQRRRKRPNGQERRLINNKDGRRVGERRGRQSPVPPPELPTLPDALASHVLFVEADPRSPWELRHMRATYLALCTQGGDENAFKKLFGLCYDDLYAYVRARMDGNCDAEDIAQEVMFRARERIATFTYRGKPFRAWLFKIARNGVERHSSRRRVEPMDPKEVARLSGRQANGEPGILDLITGNGFDSFENEKLGRLFAELSEGDKELLEHRYVRDLSRAETAEVLGKKTPAVARAEQRILASFREKLGGEPPEGLESKAVNDRRGRRPAMLRRMGPLPVLGARRFALWESQADKLWRRPRG